MKIGKSAITVTIIALLCLIVAVVAQGGDDWLMPGHDPRNSYRTGRAGLIRSQPSLLWRLSMPDVIGTLIIADLNRDGYPEWGIVDKQGVNIYQGEQLLYTLASPFSDAQMADLAVLYDKDGNKRILCVWQRLVEGAVADEGLIVAISANEDRILWSASLEEAIVTMALGDIDGNGYPEILVGTSKGLYAIDADGALLWTLGVGDGVRSMALGDVDGDGFLDILVASKETVSLFGK